MSLLILLALRLSGARFLCQRIDNSWFLLYSKHVQHVYYLIVFLKSKYAQMHLILVTSHTNIWGSITLWWVEHTPVASVELLYIIQHTLWIKISKKWSSAYNDLKINFGRHPTLVSMFYIYYPRIYRQPIAIQKHKLRIWFH